MAMRPILQAAALAALGLVAAAAGEIALPPGLPDAADPHLETLPRTAAEAARIAAATAAPAHFDAPQPFEAWPGGAATSRKRANRDAFSNPSANLGFAGELEFKVGNGLFKKLWVSAPASTRASDGLGPLYNARACQRCHLKDGRGHPPGGPEDDATSLVLRLSVPDADGRMRPHPVLGHQIQDRAIAGHAAEGRVTVAWIEEVAMLADGTAVPLRRPVWDVADAAAPLGHAVLSARVAPPMIGLGLLEAIPAADILALADPADRDGDGISGRAAVVPSPVHGRTMLGRFGWKAAQPTLLEQSADAFAADMGLSSALHPDDWGGCTPAQTACRAAPGGGDPLEVGDAALASVVHYSRNLAVPARRDVEDSEVLAGKRLFHAAGCAACHRPAFVTHRLAGNGPQSFQLIWPYTDLLLHDLGPGLADGRPEGDAGPSEWRTPPLWGIGLTRTVNGHTQFLHDGRARDLREAILWHGGEAEAARAAFARMPASERAALLRFLGSL